MEARRHRTTENCKNCNVMGQKVENCNIGAEDRKSNLTEIPIVAITSSSPDILGLEWN
jgi:hypothetical protein